jgi:hypothetical protein
MKRCGRDDEELQGILPEVAVELVRGRNCSCAREPIDFKSRGRKMTSEVGLKQLRRALDLN